MKHIKNYRLFESEFFKPNWDSRSLGKLPYLGSDTPRSTLPIKVAGPFGKDVQKFYIFSKGGQFYIYQTNASQKTPILMGGNLWSNTGKGYDTQEEALKIIQDQLASPMRHGQLTKECLRGMD